jgi:von Willebrand factor type A domain
MSDMILPRKTLGGWLRRHSLTIVAALGGAAGVAYAAGWHAKSSAPVPVSVAMAATPATQKIAEPPRDTVQDTVQIALLLDTSSSMDGLINQARSQLWNMVDQMGRMTRLVDGKLRGVKVELALYEYGNDRLSAKSGFIRQVSPFSTDLDRVSEALHGLSTNGGSEYVGQVIQTAANQLQWSADSSALRFIFVAGNEEFNQGPISADTAMMAAARKDIHVQLIYCGGKEPTWEAAAKLAMSDLMTIDQNQVAQHIPSPQDADILRLGNELNGTYMAYGNDGAASAARQAKADASSAAISPKVALERAQLKSKKSYSNANWDLVDAVEKNGKFLEQASDDELPAGLRGKTAAEKQQIVAANAARRAQLKAKIAQLEAERTRFLDAERARTNAAEPQMLETELMKSSKKVAAKKGYKF